MSLLMPLVNDIVYSLNTTDLAYLVTVQLLAMATHPTAPLILYTLYGAQDNATNGYQQFQLQTWFSSSQEHQLLSNRTLTDSFVCTPNCRLEVPVPIWRSVRTYCKLRQ